MTDDPTSPSLAAGDARLLVDFDGGIVARWAISGRDIFRPLPADIRNDREKPLRSGCFPLAPYCNRIVEGRFNFEMQRYQLPLNFGDHPHAIHGIAWQRRWTLEAQGADHLTIGLAEPAGDWPWAFSVRQTFRLAADALEIAIETTNRSERAMPAGIGLHPYFADADGGRVDIAADSVWLTDQSGIPTDKARYPAGLPSAPDNCLTGWNGRATITWPDRRLGLSAHSPLDHLHYYRPADADFLCLEPVSHAPDALNGTGAPMAILAPGETLSGAVRMEIR
ncbi:aldose 1-epimerase [Parasphingopyxis algicola]|uniref:aldose 1-epimerase n=1 Tax=Parasphingopyxis algicola TaxID=2026624 RepID=UPI0015A47A15|nr:aldose 1-epimerase [Parasphingopyxis algicola]QLC24745.1 aldose 1-epimerase [Parasphingopyxis algicola]